MDSTVLTFPSLDVNLPALLGELRVRPGSDGEAEVLRLAAELRSIAQAKAVYKVVFIEERGDDYIVADGARLSSRVLRVNLDGINRLFPFVATTGREAEAWALAQDGVVRRFWADAANQALLYAAVAALQEHLCDRFALEAISMMNPGSLADWPLREQRNLFSLLGDVRDAVGVELTQSLLMVPTKSVSGIFFPSQETFASCQLCPREVCPNRRAPYDPELYEKKYRQTQPLAPTPRSQISESE